MVIESAYYRGIEISKEALLMIEGVKPAYLQSYGKDFSKVTKRSKELDFLQAFYPTLNFPHRGNTRLIFRSASDLQKFVATGARIVNEPADPDNVVMDWHQEELGITLGYPPLAAHWFKNENRGAAHNELTSINYHGIQFCCAPSDADECIKWMEDNRPVPEHLQTTVTQKKLGASKFKNKR